MNLKQAYQKNLRLIKKTLFIGALLLSALYAFADRYSHLELFAQTLSLIKINYFKPLKIENLVRGAIKGLLREIDPHSHFLNAKELKRLEDETKGQFYGLGIEVEKKDDFLIIISIIKNSPAAKTGLLPGDKILKINGKSIKSFNKGEFRYLFKKQRKKPYKITVFREEEGQTLVYKAKAAYLKTQSADFKEIEKGLFYIRIYYFSDNTFAEVNKFLKNKKIKGLILDLRGNFGGVFESSVKIADLFLNEGLIVRYKIKTEKSAKDFSAHYSNTLDSFPLAVLIDEYSASASEIVAGALKDHKRAVLLGRKSFGKGSIQTVFYLKKGFALKLTVGEYQTPSGKFIHEKGIEPDIKIKKSRKKTAGGKKELKDFEVQKAIDVLKRKIAAQNLKTKKSF